MFDVPGLGGSFCFGMPGRSGSAYFAVSGGRDGTVSLFLLPKRNGKPSRPAFPAKTKNTRHQVVRVERGSITEYNIMTSTYVSSVSDRRSIGGDTRLNRRVPSCDIRQNFGTAQEKK